MKIKTFFIRCLVIPMVALLSNCSDGDAETKKLIIGKWKWDSFKSKRFDEEKAKLKAKTELISDPIEKAKELKNGNLYINGSIETILKKTMEFKADGSYQLIEGGFLSFDGNWKTADNGKRIITTTYGAFEKIDTLVIIELTSDEFVFKDIWGNSDYIVTCKPISK